MASLKDRVSAKVEHLRQRIPWFDHVVRTLQHYGDVNGNAQAGAVTFFGFLSVFPILALAFFVVGHVAKVYPDIHADLQTAINDLLPGIIGSGKGQIEIAEIEKYAATVGLIGLVSLVYSGLGWLSGMRQALEAMFVVPRAKSANFVFGKLRDLGTLALVGAVLMVSVALSGAVTGFSGSILDWVGVDPHALVPAVLLSLLGHALAIVASTVLLLVMFKLLVTEPHVPGRAMLSGAVVGAVGFEVLKLVANLLLAQTQKSPAFQAFGVALILLIWINYFSRLVMYAAAWAYTAPAAHEIREAEAMRAPGAALVSSEDQAEVLPAERQTVAGRRSHPVALIAVAAAVVAVVAVVLRRARMDA